MRFSSIFQSPLTQPLAAQPPAPARVEEPVPSMPQPLAAAAPEVPDDLDQRVRMVGEWQLGEGC